MPDAEGRWTREDHERVLARREVAEARLAALGMSAGLRTILINEGCYTLEDTLRFDDLYWARAPGCGKVRQAELKRLQQVLRATPEPGDEDWW